jgi:hypothetical protein
MGTETSGSAMFPLKDLSMYDELTGENWAFGSYNLSFVIEKNYFVGEASDNTILSRQKTEYCEANPNECPEKYFFKNEIAQIKKFIEYKAFAGIGFQEVSMYTVKGETYNNILGEFGIYKQKNEGEFDIGVKNMSYAQGYVGVMSAPVMKDDDEAKEDMYFKNSSTIPSAQAALMIWDNNKLGTCMKHLVVDFELEKNRPIQMVYTNKGFLLVNFHAPNLQGKGYRNTYLAEIFFELSGRVKAFIATLGVSVPPKQIIFMTDLNDHRNFMIGMDEVLTYDTKARYMITNLNSKTKNL